MGNNYFFLSCPGESFVSGVAEAAADGVGEITGEMLGGGTNDGSGVCGPVVEIG